jgi:glycosyltransferase involved in cell wall biosynthesis
MLSNIFFRRPWQVAQFASAAFGRAIHAAIKDCSPDLVHVQLIRSAHYLAHWRERPRVLDLIDCLSLQFRRRAAIERPAPRRWLYAEEARRVARWEASLCPLYDGVVVVSEPDRRALPRPATAEVIPMGVLSSEFALERRESPNPMLVFTGYMGNHANVNAAIHLARNIFPVVRATRPDAELYIVGADPGRSVRELGNREGVRVTGRVPDVAEYLQRAWVSVCPMISGSGMQIKMLEAMAAAVPVVASPFAAAGIAGRPGEHFLVGETPEAVAEHVLRLICEADERRRVGQAGQQLVASSYTWEASTSALERLYERIAA